VVLPIIRPGLAALAVWTVIGTWNDFQLPLVVLGDGTKFTVPLALTTLSTTHYSDTPAVMLATLMGLVPVFVLFALLSRQFIAGLTSGAVKS
jgi:ABC-type glycerol-3-phosphate transport system permease component